MRTITIGRSSSCDIVVPDDRVSRIHGELSIVNGQYVFRDTSTNGSTLNGEYISNRAVAIAPGAPVMLSNRVPLPWAQIYALLPLPGSGGNVAYHNGGHTHVDNFNVPNAGYNQDNANFGWCILAFLIPLVGWILYFVWKDKYPNKAATVAKWAWIGFGVNILLTIISR